MLQVGALELLAPRGDAAEQPGVLDADRHRAGDADKERHVARAARLPASAAQDEGAEDVAAALQRHGDGRARAVVRGGQGAVRSPSAGSITTGRPDSIARRTSERVGIETWSSTTALVGDEARSS